MDVVNIDRVTPYITKDGSEIRELLSHRNSVIRNQSLAEARLAPGGSTTLHHHPRTEEIYFILTGAGRMRVGDDISDIAAGDAIAIPSGAPHQLTNTSDVSMRLLCCCSPAYEHDDTVLMGGEER